MASGSVQSVTRVVVELNQTASAGRGTITGLYAYKDDAVMLNLIFTSTVSASNSPGVINIGALVGNPKYDCALSCIDITSGIASSITGSIPAGISTNGSVYMKECIAGHVYAISGEYIRTSPS